MAEVYTCLDVLEGPEVEIGPDDENYIDLSLDLDLESSYWETHTHLIMSDSDEIQQPDDGGGPNGDIYEVDQILDGPRRRKEHNVSPLCFSL